MYEAIAHDGTIFVGEGCGKLMEAYEDRMEACRNRRNGNEKGKIMKWIQSTIAAAVKNYKTSIPGLLVLLTLIALYFKWLTAEQVQNIVGALVAVGLLAAKDAATIDKVDKVAVAVASKIPSNPRTGVLTGPVTKAVIVAVLVTGLCRAQSAPSSAPTAGPATIATPALASASDPKMIVAAGGSFSDAHQAGGVLFGAYQTGAGVYTAGIIEKSPATTAFRLGVTKFVWRSGLYSAMTVADAGIAQGTTTSTTTGGSFSGGGALFRQLSGKKDYVWFSARVTDNNVATTSSSKIGWFLAVGFAFGL